LHSSLYIDGRRQVLFDKKGGQNKGQNGGKNGGQINKQTANKRLRTE
jgi:hypothetical protein